MGETQAGQAGVGFFMGKVVSDVGKPGTARGEVGNNGQGLLNSQVHGVRVIAQGVEDQIVETKKQRAGGRGEGREVGEIGGAADAETENLLVTVDEGDGDEEGGVGSQWMKGSGDGVEGNLGDDAESGKAVKNVGKGAAQDGLRVVRGEDGHGKFLAHVKRTDVVEAENVVGVGVGEDQGVEAFEASAEGLGAEVGRGVDDDVAAGMGDEQGGASAVVAGVRRTADAALAAE